MPVLFQVMLWGIAAALPVLLNGATKRSSDALGLSAMIFLMWVMGRVFWAIWTPPEAMQWYPVMDAAAGITSFYAWRTRGGWWKIALTMLFVAQCALHTAFWLAYPTDGSVYRYILVNNVLFALELVCAAYPGGQYVMARYVVGRLPGRPGSRDHARA